MKINKTLSCILLFLLIFSIVNLVQAAPVWRIQTVDRNGFFLQGGIIRLDSNNKPHIAYSDYAYPDVSKTDINVMYASYTGSSWSIQTVAKDGLIIDFALDSHDNPHIIYKNTVNYIGLKYAGWNGTAWNIQTVDPMGLSDASLAIDTDDNPHIAYTVGDLKYASLNGSNWNIQTLTNTGNNSHPYLALDKQNNPHIMFEEGVYPKTEKSIKYAKLDPEIGWNIQTVVANLRPDVGFNLFHFALDSYGYPHFTYRRFYSDLSYNSWDGTSWQSQTIASYMDWGGYFTLDRYNNPHIVYFTGSSLAGDLLYARWAGNGWDIQTVANSTATASGSISVDYNGTIHISYAGPSLHGNQSPTDVMYATATEPFLSPTPTTTPVTSPAQIIEATIVISIIVVVTVVAGLLVFLKKRKH